MANEIEIQYTVSAVTLYAIVRNSTGEPLTVSGLTFGTYSTASLSGYKIALTEQGTASRFYAADFPNVPPGNYGIVVFQQLGGSPAETDTVIGMGNIEWGDSNAVVSLASRAQPSDNIGINWSNITNKTASNNFSNTTTNSVGSLVNKTGFSLANGSIVTATFGTCDFTSDMKTSLNAATPTSIQNVDNVWTVTTRELSGTINSFDELSTALSSAHGAGSWATATGFASPTDVTNARDHIETHGDIAWATATGFSTFDETTDAVFLTGAYDAAKTAAQAGDIMKVSSGTGANQLNVTSGVVMSQLANGVAHGGTLGSSTATLALSRINITSQTTNTNAITVLGNGTGDGIRTTGGAASGHGAAMVGGGGSGLFVGSTADNASAMILQAQGTNSHGLDASSSNNFSISAANGISGNLLGLVDGIAGTTQTLDALQSLFTFTQPGFVDVNIQYVNDIEIKGTGTAGDPWNPV